MAEQELTAEEKTTIVKWLGATWDYIADDCFLDDRGKLDYRKTCSRAEVFELCADRIDITRHTQTDRDLCWKFHGQSEKVKKELMERAFPHKVYGY